MTELNYRPSVSAVRYIPPRSFRPIRFVSAALVGAVLAVAIGWVYVFALAQVDHIVLRMGSTALCGVVLGLLCVKVVRYARVASQPIAALLGCALGAITLYTSWILWMRRIINAILQRRGVHVSPWYLVRHPIELRDMARDVNRFGTWSFGSNIIRGLPLLVVWLIEAILLIATAVYIAVKSAAPSTPLCRECGASCERVRRLPRLAVDRAEDVVAVVEARNFAALAEQEPLLHDDDPELNFYVYACPRCGGTNVLSLQRTAWVIENGQQTVRTKVLVENLLITKEEVEQLRQLGAEFAERKAAASEPSDGLNEPSETRTDAET